MSILSQLSDWVTKFEENGDGKIMKDRQVKEIEDFIQQFDWDNQLTGAQWLIRRLADMGLLDHSDLNLL